MRKSTLIALIITLVGIFSLTAALADMGSLAVLRQENNIEQARLAKASLVAINGQLICNLGKINTARACTLMLRDREGRIYTLRNSNNAMRLFTNGTRRVRVEGTLVQADTIQVNTVSALKLN